MAVPVAGAVVVGGGAAGVPALTDGTPSGAAVAACQKASPAPTAVVDGVDVDCVALRADEAATETTTTEAQPTETKPPPKACRAAGSARGQPSDSRHR